MKTKLYLFAALAAVACTRGESTETGPLALWSDGASRDAIINFVKQAVTPDSPGFIPRADRIAVFDNDGTLWCEHPLYFEMVYAVAAAGQIVREKPELQKLPELKALAGGDMATFMKDPGKSIPEAFAIAHAGPAEEADLRAKMWLDTARHERFGVPYRELTYSPMVELLIYLRINGFKTYIVSGGSNTFIRLLSDGAYGIPSEQVIGTMLKAQFTDRDGNYGISYLPEVWHMDDAAGKPEAIAQLIGKKPVLAFGNSDGDLQMLQWTSSNSYPSLCLLLHHTDAEREYAYDSLSTIGTLKKALYEAHAKKWTVVDMKKDFREVFKGM